VIAGPRPDVRATPYAVQSRLLGAALCLLGAFAIP